MYEWAGDAPASVLVLTKGAQRAAILQRFATRALTIPMSVALVPDENGRKGLNELRSVVCAAECHFGVFKRFNSRDGGSSPDSRTSLSEGLAASHENA
jgi:hypothetical protein